jgi:hypothetical protein
MATQRKSTKGKAGGRQGARGSGTGRPGRARSGAGSAGTRKARHGEAAREVARTKARNGRTGAEKQPAAAAEGTGPTLRLAEPPVVEEGTGRPGSRGERIGSGAGEGASGEAADRQAAELARKIEETVGAAGETLRMGPASASDRLRVHREEMEEAARRQEGARDLPGVWTLGLELAAGALRLVGAMATAPIRLGLAFLRRSAAEA